MKKILILAIVTIFAVVSCRKYNTLGYTPGTGAPTITSVHTLTTSEDTGTVQRVIVTMDSTGQMDTTSYAVMAPPEALDSVTAAGNLGQYYVIYGTNLGSATQVAFNGAVAYLNRAWNTDNSIIVDIPSNAPFYGSGATDTLTVTTTHGSVSYYFSIIPPPPTINAVSDYDFWTGSQITLTGVGFINVTSVGLVNSGSKSTTPVATATIVSQNDSVLVLQFPQSTLNRANLLFSYTSVGVASTATSTQEFVDLDNAYTIFASGNNQNGWSDNSWTNPSGPNNGAVHSYGQTESYVMTFPNGGWQIEGWAGATTNVPYFANYKYFTFWMKGGVQQEVMTIVADQLPSGWGQETGSNIFTITVPASVWTYFKIPIGSGSGDIPFLSAAAAQSAITASGNNRLSLFIAGPSAPSPATGETFYLDEVAFTN